MFDDLSKEIEARLGLRASAELRAVCRPSFHAECGFALEGSTLTVSCATRSLWTHLNAVRGVPGFGGLDAWVAPAIGREPIALPRVEVERIHAAVGRLASAAPREPGMRLDGMPVSLRVAERSFAPWFSSDAETAEGQVVLELHRAASAHARWRLTCDALASMRAYFP